MVISAQVFPDRIGRILYPSLCYSIAIILSLKAIGGFIQNSSKGITRMYSTVHRGYPNSSNYRIYFKNSEGKVISPFHDIPWKASQVQDGTLYNMVVEIPRWTNAKMEIATKEPMNPIKQDIKNGDLRYVHNIYPFKGYIWNYGAIPQTWENPKHVDASTSAKGDNDPIDVCEIGSKTLERGQVVPVKVLGVLALIDVGETDWKLIVIRADDPLAQKLNDVADIESVIPGLLADTYKWFKIYKVPDGKPENKFGLDGKFMDAEFAKKVIGETHEQWKSLIHGSDPNQELDLKNISQENSPFKVSSETSEQILNIAPSFGVARELSREEFDKINQVSYVH